VTPKREGVPVPGPLHHFASRIQDIPAAEVDDIDLKLLKLLAQDGRASLKSLAAEIGLSSPAVSDRITRLTAKGVIRGFNVDIDWEVLGFSTVAYLSIVAKDSQDQNSLMDALLNIPRVEEVSVVTGSTDMMVKIRAAGFGDLRQLLAEEIWALDGILRTETLITLFSAENQHKSFDLLERMSVGAAAPVNPGDGSSTPAG
jgi:DNA-binding Lrp family transcriptional regulator